MRKYLLIKNKLPKWYKKILIIGSIILIYPITIFVSHVDIFVFGNYYKVMLLSVFVLWAILAEIIENIILKNCVIDALTGSEKYYYLKTNCIIDFIFLMILCIVLFMI